MDLGDNLPDIAPVSDREKAVPAFLLLQSAAFIKIIGGCFMKRMYGYSIDKRISY